MQTNCPYALRPGLTEPPRFIKRLPVDTRGYPIPAFAGEVNGQRDFRVIDADHFVRCVREGRCWVCGEFLFEEKVFVIGPMCAINRISSEPPSHRECAVWSAINCPFLSKPTMKRNASGLDLDELEANSVGIPIRRNPGVTLVWYTRRFELVRVNRGYLFKVGRAFKTEWYAEGRAATRAEILHSIETGYPLLEAEAKREGDEAIAALAAARSAAMLLVPQDGR